ncbi:MAG: Ger(x)C family spore germination protein [Alicyclobacillus herbarius]|uniref:Ger(x)C family spore germination protein n=1 Tax=Alicyclobacillus herbarius TaxID=122960 RepID=UPI0023558032|nr:Ger(x)C family spore germination protein [Alicyclobacillus herbarius]MCL6633786.1 Ger(x)C family spore germination protein [Alicyclobacillus herbarius]
MKRLRVLTMALCLSVCLLMTGCWDGEELQQRAIVLMLGIDPGGHPGTVKVTAQVVRPHQANLPNGKSSSGSSPEDSPVVAISREGQDVIGALHNIQLSIDRTLFFGHLQAMMINRQLAQRGALEILNPILQSRIARRQLWLFVSDPPTITVLQQVPKLDVIPAMYLSNLFRNQVWVNHSYDGTIGGFHQRMATPGIEPYTFLIRTVDPHLSAPQIDGIAVFSGDRMVGSLSGSRFRGWSLMSGQLPKSTVPIACPRDPRHFFTLNVKSAHTRFRVRGWDTGRPYVNVEVSLRGTISGGPCIRSESPQGLEHLQLQAATETANLIRDAIHWAQAELRSDVFGVGREVYRHDPKHWRGDSWWRTVFPRLGVRVHVNSEIDYMNTYHKSELIYRGS